MPLPHISVMLLLPFIILLLTTAACTALGFLVHRQAVTWTAMAGLIITAASLIPLWDRHLSSFGGALLGDPFGIALSLVILLGALLALLSSLDSAKRSSLSFPEYDLMLLLGVLGSVLLAMAGNLIVLLIGLEIMSLSAYVLATLQASRSSEEAGMKYFLLGAVGSAVLIYGIALVYGATGHFGLSGIAAALGHAAASNLPVLLLGTLMLLVGFGFKVALVPFHQWTPDVYSGSPTLVTLYMSVVIKTAAFAGLIRVFQMALSGVHGWVIPAEVIIALTLILGNFAALREENFKRMLAYSAVAHSGYLALALVAKSSLAEPALIYYLLTYTLMNAGAFAVVAVLQRDDSGVTISDLRGLYSRRPGLAVALAALLASLSGLPPFAGFFGKFVLFSAALQSGFVGLTVIAAVTSMAALFYYLRPAALMFFSEPAQTPQLPAAPRQYSAVAVWVAVGGTLLLGVLPNLVMQLLQRPLT